MLYVNYRRTKQAQVIESEAVETGDKEAVKELIDELKAKHAKEKSKLKQELDATERMLKVSRDSSSKKEEEIINLKTDLESKKFSAERWKGEAKSFFEALAKTQNQIREGCNQLLVLSEQLETVQIDDRTYDAAKSAFLRRQQNFTNSTRPCVERNTPHLWRFRRCAPKW